MADAPAAAAAPSAPAKPAPTPTPSGKAPAPFDARLQLAKSLAPQRVVMPEAAAPGGEAAAEGDDGAAPGDGDGEAAEPAAEAAEGTPGDGEADGEAGGEEADGDGEGADPSSPQEALEAVSKAFDAGDIEAMAAALKKAGVKVSGPTRRAFRAFQRRLQKADERDRAAEQRDREFNEARARAQQQIADDTRRLTAAERELTRKFGTAYELETAWANEDMVALGKTLEKACKGASLAEITQKLATGKTGKTAEERRLAERERQLEEREARKGQEEREQQEKQQRAQQREAAISRVGEGLKSHPYLQTIDPKTKLPKVDAEALREVFEAYEGSWNGEKFTKTARQCADELQEKLLARATARGLAPAAPPAAPAAKTGKPPGKKPPQRTGLREPPRTQRAAGAALDLEATRAARVAEARRRVEMQRRGVIS